jgi:hypothetical protein
LIRTTQKRYPLKKRTRFLLNDVQFSSYSEWARSTFPRVPPKWTGFSSAKQSAIFNNKDSLLFRRNLTSLKRVLKRAGW